MLVRVTAHPSLALAKYWGKAPDGINIPTMTSIAVSLNALTTTTEVSIDVKNDSLIVNGRSSIDENHSKFFDAIRRELSVDCHFKVVSTNTFPTAAGIASSASGYAALALGCSTAAGISLSAEKVSALARIGSGSACRSVYGGFTRWNAGSPFARQIFDHTWWPELRILVCITESSAKKISSRDAMNRCRNTSALYQEFVEHSKTLAELIHHAIEERDLSKLGPLVRESYLGMTATMLTAHPPILYWNPGTVGLLNGLEALRDQGLNAWETMDAGPQVKCFCLASEIETIMDSLSQRVPGCNFIVCGPAQSPTVEVLQ